MYNKNIKFYNRHSVLKGVEFLNNQKPIFISTVLNESVYNPETDVSTLQMNGFIEISIVVDGSGIHRILNEDIECREGDVFILNSGVLHGYFAKDTSRCIKVSTLSFDPKAWFDGKYSNTSNDNFCYGVFRDNAPVSYAMLNSKAMIEVKDILKRIESELKIKDTEWTSVVESYLILLLVTLARYLNLEDTVYQMRPKEWGKVSEVIKMVHKGYGDADLTLESIATELYVSKSNLSRVFQKVVGKSFLEYVHNVRINKACDLLQSSSLTNEEIASKCGLKDVPSFYKLFKNIMGTTPYQYRMTHYVSKEGEENMIVKEISENIQCGKAKIVKELVQKAVDEGVPVAQILNEGLIGGMSVIGEKFKNNEVYVPEVLVAARAMNMGVQILKPLLFEEGVESKGKICLGTVQGDLHDIGKNLVKFMMEGKGIEVIDLGVDVAPETFIKTAIEQECKVICCSALLTTTMTVMEDIVKEAEKAGIRDKIKIMIGGAPVTQEFCDKIGADCYSEDAASAADAAVAFCEE